MSAQDHDVVQSAAFASQSAFRALMDAMARPGEVNILEGTGAPAPMAPATAALVRSLADYETPIWLDATFAAAPAVTEWIRFHTGAPIVTAPGDAAFALIADPRALPDFTAFAQGSEEYPDRSTTAIIQIERFAGPALVLKGPGIKTILAFAAEPLPDDFSRRLRDNRELFPRGIDLVFVAGRQIAALPRSVRVVEN
ncbi:MAG: phosphonate C-P lyase system protein PhnH [Pseudolabrys sp.]|nr:phosphonate C-P lyase system protein PhnH [Pseudolabrys sp.]MDP2297209.1 phosphonate C-P lyase system protein PhnH [Pseudolabrys sp.]